ncbi:YutD family protein [Sporosarcina trichiuri]|uniref:YutD family protein n=1 Tax=Sporosarcina trichiuri TaxID=3056445 RepID=UPI0025B5CA12|nr:YutD family protein [Sporosarcina sp. 0.2-SM1T-5]WJY27779.1 YutD family protein [Sporosarcina sp. 0.2-SM1T-5]
MTEQRITLDQVEFEVIENHRDGFNSEALESRYSEILSKYDYILGDWGYGQLRLKGFFDDRSSKATYETKISTLQDYLYEYCNFGCAHFVLKKIGKVKKEQPDASQQPKDGPVKTAKKTS